jgi:hypothetical protein
MACLDPSGQLFKVSIHFDLIICCCYNDDLNIQGQSWESVPQPELFSGIYDKSPSQYECPAIND